MARRKTRVLELKDLGDKRAAAEHRWWQELEALCDEDDVQGFYAHYAAYLQWNAIISRQREILYLMALAASKVEGKT